MAFDAFLKIEGADEFDPTENIQIESFSWGATNPPSLDATGGGGGTGKVNVHDISITKQTDKASASLFTKCCAGEHIRQATITCRKAGKPEDYYVIKLEDCLISSYSAGGNHHGEAVPSESFSLNFTKITYSCAGGRGGWDLATAKKV
jgi:type VI secretion system secreted protein Hcp